MTPGFYWYFYDETNGLDRKPHRESTIVELQEHSYDGGLTKIIYVCRLDWEYTPNLDDFLNSMKPLNGHLVGPIEVPRDPLRV